MQPMVKRNFRTKCENKDFMEGPVQGQTLTQIIPHVPDPKANFLPHVPISRKKIIRKGFVVELSSMQYTHPLASQGLALSFPDPPNAFKSFI